MAYINPFVIFAPNVWVMVLKNLEDSKDVQNAFKAFPELEAIMSSTRHLWMSDQAIPHIASWLTKEELLAVRQVCKPWSRAVNGFLQNHQNLRPCSSNQISLVTGQFWTPPAAPKRYSFYLPMMAERFICDSHDVENFLHHFNGHPVTKNPFIERSLHVRFPSENIMIEYFESIKKIFLMYGHQIWYVTFYDGWDVTDRMLNTFIRIVKKCVKYLPNLKGINMIKNDDQRADEYQDEQESSNEDEIEQINVNNANNNEDEDDCIQLHQLESIKLHVDITSHLLPRGQLDLLNPFILGFSLQLKRLEIPLNFWNQAYSNMFSNLSELTIIANEGSKSDLDDMMTNLHAPNLSELKLMFYGFPLREHDMIGWLKRFSQIKSFVLLPTVFAFCWTELDGEHDLEIPTNAAELIPSLISFKLRCRSILNYDFLQFFPSIKYLRIVDVPLPEDCRSRKIDSQINLQDYFTNKELYNANLWQLLPSLEMITVNTYVLNSPTYHFTRAMYDHLNKNVNHY